VVGAGWVGRVEASLTLPMLARRAPP
jgi:hypothetical protein